MQGRKHGHRASLRRLRTHTVVLSHQYDTLRLYARCLRGRVFKRSPVLFVVTPLSAKTICPAGNCSPMAFWSALCRISLLARLIRPSSFSLVPLVVFVHRFTGDILLLLEPLHAHCDTRCCDIGIVHAEWPHHKSTRQRRALASLQRQKSRCVCFTTSHGCSSNVTVP